MGILATVAHPHTQTPSCPAPTHTPSGPQVQLSLRAIRQVLEERVSAERNPARAKEMRAVIDAR